MHNKLLIEKYNNLLNGDLETEIKNTRNIYHIKFLLKKVQHK